MLSTRVPRPTITAGEPASRQRRRTCRPPPWGARWPGRYLRLRRGTTIAIAVAASAHRGMGRGFLPRGLSNTCPQVSAARDTVAAHGQVSNKPKQKQPSTVLGPLCSVCCRSPPALELTVSAILQSFKRAPTVPTRHRQLSGVQLTLSTASGLATGCGIDPNRRNKRQEPSDWLRY